MLVPMRVALPVIALELGVSDRTLRRAVAQGLVRAERPSSRTLEIGLRERGYLQEFWPHLSQLRKVLRTEPKVSLAVLFGSRARGDATSDSDVDLLVSLRDGGNYCDIRSRLESRLGCRVQLILLNEAEEAPRLLSEVLHDGRVLVDRHADWPTLTKRARKIRQAADTQAARLDSEFAKLLVA